MIAYMLLVTTIGYDLLWTYALLLSYMFMYSWRMMTVIGDDEYLYSIIDDDYDVMFASWGDDLGDDWYHMHIGVMSRRIAWFDMSHNCLNAWWLLWLVICILDELYTCELCNFVVCRSIKCWWTCDNVNLYMLMNNVEVELLFCLIIWSLNWWTPFQLIIFIYKMWTNPQWSFGWPPHYI